MESTPVTREPRRIIHSSTQIKRKSVRFYESLLYVTGLYKGA